MIKKQLVEMMGRQIELEISRNAKTQLDTRSHPLLVEMELYFSCLLRKQVRIRESALDYSEAGDTNGSREDFLVRLSDKLHIQFRPVMTKFCSLDSVEGGSPPLSDFPIEKPQSYVPKWLKLDYKKGHWCGDFGY